MSSSVFQQSATISNGNIPYNEQNDTDSLKGSSFEASFATDNVQFQSSLIEPVVQIENVCEEVLGSKMAALELTEETTKNNGCDGSDSGVDIATCLSVGLQRALSSNSGGYASSNGCLDEINLNGNISCDSSMISYSSDIGESHKTANTVLGVNSNYECTSENGSESSSVAGGPTSSRKLNSVKKKVGLTEPVIFTRVPRRGETSPSVSTICQQNNSSRISRRAVSVSRTQSLTRPSPPVIQTRERARSREKGGASSSSSKTTTPPFRSTPVRSRPPKPDSLPIALITASPSIQRFIQRTPSLTRGSKTPGTPSDDGRWPSVGGRGGIAMPPKRGGSAVPDLASLKSRVNMLSLDSAKSPTSVNAFATLPRRKKQKSVEDLTNDRNSRSNSASRDKMTSSVVVSGKKSTPSREQTPSKISFQFPRPRKLVATKIKIYHETSQQTAITGPDLENAFAGNPLGKLIKIDAAEFKTKGTQSDIRDKELEAMREKLKQLTHTNTNLEAKLEEKSKKVAQMDIQLSKEREEKFAVQKELHLNTERVIGMLEMTRGTPTEEQGYDSLLMLESQIQMSGHELNEKQEEINKLRRLCRTLQNEVERSLASQECLLSEKSILERESSELQDFLQYEKTALSEALKETEIEVENLNKRLDDKDEEIKVLRDECRHLVRLNEQRRQENKAMQSKYAVLESRNRELTTQKNAAVSGASMALSGLNSRLDSLVEQLISSYNISEQDLEDVVFHNEAYTQSGGSTVDGSPENNCNNDGKLLNGQQYSTSNNLLKPEQHYQQKQQHQQLNNDGSLSPQRNQSFIAAVINAIKNATISSSNKKQIQHKYHISNNKKINENLNEDESDSTEMLDSETEPCLMMDNVLEDVAMPDSHSHNMVSSNCNNLMISQIEIPSELMTMQGDESLHNLSQAITNRQQIEMQVASQKFPHLKSQNDQCSMDDSCHDSLADMPSISEYCPSTQTLVDQVIEVDNSVTKLLKVLRLIQMDNDNCIQQLITDKNKLQLNKEEMLEKLKDIEDINVKLRDELMDATEELMMQGNDLSNSKNEIQRHRNEIDRLNQEICNLNQICENSSSIKSDQTEFDILSDLSKDSILRILKIWREQGYLQDPEILGFILTACKEIPLRKMFGLENNICLYPHILQNQTIISESKKQYDIIDHTLDVLYNLQDLVEENPTLMQLQKELEEANFNSITTNNLPFYTAYLKSTLPDKEPLENYYDCDGSSSAIDEFNANSGLESVNSKNGNYN